MLHKRINQQKANLLICKNLFIACLSLSFCIKTNAQSLQNANKLFWSENHRLTISDFKGIPTKDDTVLQNVSPNLWTHKLGAITKSIDVFLNTEKNQTTFTIRAGMLPEFSWIKDPADTIELKHEQGHFDICEIYARMLRRDIKKAHSLAEAKSIYEKISTDEETEQDAYDLENTFQAGGITADWKEKIASRLEVLKAFKNPVIILPFDH